MVETGLEIKSLQKCILEIRSSTETPCYSGATAYAMWIMCCVEPRLAQNDKQRLAKYMLCLKKLEKGEKNSMNGPKQFWTWGHPIYPWMLTKFTRWSGIFSLLFYLSISIGTLGSDSLSSSTPCNSLLLVTQASTHILHSTPALRHTQV